MKANKRHPAVVLGSLVTAGIVCGVALAGNPHSTPPGQAKKQSGASASASLSTAAGVKPSSTTSATGKNTSAAAASNRTKLYGNGKTAGQIAMSNGATADTMLTGPGNSQPHKVSVCPGSKHSVDVHALKSHPASSCAASSTNSSTSASTSTSSSVSTTTSPGTSAGVAGAATSGTQANHSSSTGGVLGAQHGGAVNGNAKPATPVLGAANFTG